MTEATRQHRDTMGAEALVTCTNLICLLEATDLPEIGWALIPMI